MKYVNNLVVVDRAYNLNDIRSVKFGEVWGQWQRVVVDFIMSFHTIKTFWVLAMFNVVILCGED